MHCCGPNSMKHLRRRCPLDNWNDMSTLCTAQPLHLGPLQVYQCLGICGTRDCYIISCVLVNENGYLDQVSFSPMLDSYLQYDILEHSTALSNPFLLLSIRDTHTCMHFSRGVIAQGQPLAVPMDQGGGPGWGTRVGLQHLHQGHFNRDGEIGCPNMQFQLSYKYL